MVNKLLAARHLVQGRKHSNSCARSAQLGEFLRRDAVRDSHARYCLLQKHILRLCNSLQSSLACKAKPSLKPANPKGKATCQQFRTHCQQLCERDLGGTSNPDTSFNKMSCLVSQYTHSYTTTTGMA